MGSIPVQALNFFSGLISQLLKLSIYCDDLHLLKMYFPQYKYMTFMHSYHNSYDVSMKNLVLNQLIIPSLKFFTLITFLLDIVLILKGEFCLGHSWELMD